MLYEILTIGILTSIVLCTYCTYIIIYYIFVYYVYYEVLKLMLIYIIKEGAIRYLVFHLKFSDILM